MSRISPRAKAARGSPALAEARELTFHRLRHFAHHAIARSRKLVVTLSDWSLEERARVRRDGETILFAKKQAGSLRVCLVYPNRYAVAMGNLGFQAVYEIFDQ